MWITLTILSLTAITSSQENPRPKQPASGAKKLGERLIRQTTGEQDADVMADVIRNMNDVARLLEVDFDAGPDTQATQRRIMEQLDEAIKIAAAQRRATRSKQSGSTGDKRQRSKEQEQPAQQQEQTAGESETSSSTTQGGTTTDRGVTGGDLLETRRTWGRLPLRDREEVIQGTREQFLERYRAWIERYYRALQEIDD